MSEHLIAALLEAYGAGRGHAGFGQRTASHRPGAARALPPYAEQRSEDGIRRELGSQAFFSIGQGRLDLIGGEIRRRVHGAAGPDSSDILKR